jgi:hypothetical protein
MTIENNLQSIATSLATIAAYLTANSTVKTAVSVPAPMAKVATPMLDALASAIISDNAASVAQVATVAPVGMPALPVFDIPVPQVAAPVATLVAQTEQAPFANKQAMTDFVLTSYKALGAEKGAKIQDVLVALGHRNINDVPAELWGQLKAGIEALK